MADLELGQAVKDVAGMNRLSLGIRNTLARYFLFRWSRMGFNVRQQAIWARAASEAIRGE